MSAGREGVRRRILVDHITLRVRDVRASRAFYEAALEPLGARAIELGDEVAIGPEGAEDLVLAAAGGEASGPLHLAFAASGRAQVDAFHAAALAAGGRDNGPPGERERYHAGYYAAYVIDPDGHNIEAVFHDRSGADG